MAFHWPIISRLIVVIYSFGGTRWRIFVIYAKFISVGHAMERPGATEKNELQRSSQAQVCGFLKK